MKISIFEYSIFFTIQNLFTVLDCCMMQLISELKRSISEIKKKAVHWSQKYFSLILDFVSKVCKNIPETLRMANSLENNRNQDNELC